MENLSACKKYLHFQLIHRIHNLIKTFCGDMDVNLRGFAACMPDQGHNLPQASPVLRQMRSKTVPVSSGEYSLIACPPHM